MFDKVIPSIFAIKNFFDEISIVDKTGIIKYCEIFVPDMYSFTADEIIGKHLFDVFTTSTEENSEVYQVLRTGKPIIMFKEDLITYKGDKVKGYSSTYPIYKNDNLEGVAVAMKVIDSGFSKEFIALVDETRVYRSQGASNYTLDDIVTQDPYMIKVKDRIKRVSNTNSAVLIQGKTGTGKEIVAQAIHYSSKRSDCPFISQNCSAIPSNLIESTLFGTEKGSFTGAVTNKGLFELANGGTLFLDEINSMEISMQSKILKAIEEKNIRRIGGHKNIKVDIRIIAAINEDPFESIRKNRLREDLFYRLNIVSIKLSELKERKNDVELLTNHYIKYYNNHMQMKIKGLSLEVKEIFKEYSWRGNVRELRNVIESAFNIADGDFIEIHDIPEYMLKSDVKINPKNDFEEKYESYEEKLESYEKKLIVDTLASSKNKSEAAKKLNITRQALNYKLDKFFLK